MTCITIVKYALGNDNYEFKPDGFSSVVNIRNDGPGPATVQIQVGSELVLANYNEPKTLLLGDTVQQAIPEAYHRGLLIVTANTGSITAELTK